MDEFRDELINEVVLTYRPQPRTEPVEPVVLRYERPLPERMRRAPEPAPEPVETGVPSPYPAPPPMTMPSRPMWQSAIAPPERIKKSSNWVARIFVVVCVLVLLVCVGAVIWFVQSGNWSLPGGNGDPNSGDPPDNDHYHYWDEDDFSTGETTIPRYPTGGDVRLTLVSTQGHWTMTPQEIYAQVNPATVTVLGYQERSGSVGTGIIFSSDGYILTNHHVIAGCATCTVWVGNEYGSVTEYEAKLVGSDEDIDLAVLKIDGRNLPAAEFGISDELTVGDPAYAIGNPLGTELRGTFTDGMVSAINRDVDVDGVTMTLIQTTAALNSGNSGGPLINQYGQVIGVNTIKMMSDYNTIEGLGFAIPSSLAVRWVNELIEYGEVQPQPTLGLSIMKVPTELPDGELGLEVSDVVAGGSGDKAGVRVGDFIVEFNGQRVYSTESILVIRRELHVGDEVVIRVYRNGEYLDLTMVMSAG